MTQNCPNWPKNDLQLFASLPTSLPLSTKTAPVLVESLGDKKVKIGELVELSVAGS